MIKKIIQIFTINVHKKIINVIKYTQKFIAIKNICIQKRTNQNDRTPPSTKH